MKYVSMLGVVSLTFVLVGCGGEADNSKDSSGTGATGGTASGGAAGSKGTGGSLAAGGSTAGLTIDRNCNVPSDCVVQSLSCCASCGTPNPSEYAAMNYFSQYDFQRSLCGNSAACAGCDAQLGNNTLLATCEQSQCVLIDLLNHPVTACASASECNVRAPECCECGGSTSEYAVIALSSTSSFAYSSLVCSPTQACDPCAPVYPTVNVDCIAGHCRVMN